MKSSIVSKSLLFTALLAASSIAQQKVAITIYNENLALVHETRSVEIPRGVNPVNFADVAAQIDPTSVQIKVVNSPASMQILEQNYEYDLVNSSKIFEKYLEKEVKLVVKNGNEVTGKLLNAGSKDVVLQEEDGNLQIINAQEILSCDFPKLPDGLIARPTLVWEVNNTGATNREIEVSYLTRGISWHAEYVGVLDENDANMNLTGWVSIDNKSGATYKEAKLKVVAGDVNLVQKQIRRTRVQAEMQLARAADAGFQEKEFFEYHLYTLQRPATVRDNQVKQITFIPESKPAVTKRYVYEGQRDPRNASVLVEFKNEKSNGLGMALPAGKVRVYKADSDESLLFLGEDQIKHTPKDEEIRLTIGKAFDIIGEREILTERRLGKRAREQDIQITLRNHKNEAIKVTVVERSYGEWDVRNSSTPVKKKTAQVAEWEINVPADGEAKLTFTIANRW